MKNTYINEINNAGLSYHSCGGDGVGVVGVADGANIVSGSGVVTVGAFHTLALTNKADLCRTKISACGLKMFEEI
ncbi:Hypothetical predicted protein [Octopus vulgaris]|uniref:Uncharacterized protein n=1 Tax=Octopus vulgaris TaxID=6645 RepID=A0AA36B618_OCTVU|nr:Hypothetical predicted protein [Octopus vulgaris]